MKIFKMITTVAIVSFLFISCFSTPGGATRTSATDTSIYMCVIAGDDYQDYESIAIAKNSSLVTYSIDRYTPASTMLLALEIGNYVINGNSIEITTNNSHFVGTISDDKMVINEKEYVLTR
ncbi:MAG: hypothetical protein LBF95_02355 [Treponema sp.]|jgi:hypothetical protein|nr:hypothetical protein [Treponema sp.]